MREEAKQLNSRAADQEDRYIQGLSELLWKIQELEKVTIDWGRVEFSKVDQVAVMPSHPVKPRKLLVVAIGMVLGGMVGVVTALIVAAARRRAERLQQPAATN